MPSLPEDSPLPQRNRPCPGVLLKPGNPTIVFLTVCTRRRSPWLATPMVHDALRGIWLDAQAWWVGRYAIMPDHIHLFASPGDACAENGERRRQAGGSAGASPSHPAPPSDDASDVSLDDWVKYWKSQFTKLHIPETGQWHPNSWHTRLRRDENYEQKWHYVRHNPVRHGLVADADGWPYQGELFELSWH